MNIFIGNTGEGIVLVLARMDARGKLWFQHNTADDGAGISMQDRCLVSYGNNQSFWPKGLNVITVYSSGLKP